MGARMAANLLKNGHQLHVFDVNASAVKDLVSKGAQSASSPSEIASKVDEIVTMLPSNPHVREVYLNTSTGLLAKVRPQSLLIDCSTVDPGVSRDVGARAAERNAEFVDAPVSGGVGGAEAGTLTFMVGGSTAAFERARSLLQCMGKNLVHCGALGNGQAAKICNNMVRAISMIGVSEAMSLGARLGIDPKVLAGIFNTSSARCWSSDTYNPVPGVMPNVPASRGYSGGFAVDLMAKDLGLAVSAAAGVRAAVPLGAASLQLYSLVAQHGYGGKDFSSVYEFLHSKK